MCERDFGCLCAGCDTRYTSDQLGTDCWCGERIGVASTAPVVSVGAGRVSRPSVWFDEASDEEEVVEDSGASSSEGEREGRVRCARLRFDQLLALDGRGVGKDVVRVKTRGKARVYPRVRKRLEELGIEFLNERSTSLLKSGLDRYTAVLGWDHAMLIRRVGPGRYVLEAVYAHLAGGRTGTQRVFGRVEEGEVRRLDGDGRVFTIEDHGCRSKGCEAGCRWTRIEPSRKVAVDCVATFQASSCSVTTLCAEDGEFLLIAHMDAKPTIPVSAIFHLEIGAAPGTRLRAISSVYPDEEEIGKVVQGCSRAGSRPLCLTRGPMPAPSRECSGGWSNLESGFCFPLDAAPSYFGLVGAREVYKNLVSRQLTKLYDGAGDPERAVRALGEKELEAIARRTSHSQFAAAHAYVLDQLLFFLQHGGLEAKPDLARLRRRKDGGPRCAALRILLLYAAGAGEREGLMGAVISTVDAILPDLELEFLLPLTPSTWRALDRLAG